MCWCCLLSLDCSCVGRRGLKMKLATISISVSTTAVAVSSAWEASTASSAVVAPVSGSWLVGMNSPGVVVTIPPGVSSVDLALIHISEPT